MAKTEHKFDPRNIEAVVENAGKQYKTHISAFKEPVTNAAADAYATRVWIDFYRGTEVYHEETSPAQCGGNPPKLYIPVTHGRKTRRKMLDWDPTDDRFHIVIRDNGIGIPAVTPEDGSDWEVLPGVNKTVFGINQFFNYFGSHVREQVEDPSALRRNPGRKGIGIYSFLTYARLQRIVTKSVLDKNWTEFSYFWGGKGPTTEDGLDESHPLVASAKEVAIDGHGTIVRIDNFTNPAAFRNPHDVADYLQGYYRNQIINSTQGLEFRLRWWTKEKDSFELDQEIVLDRAGLIYERPGGKYRKRAGEFTVTDESGRDHKETYELWFAESRKDRRDKITVSVMNLHPVGDICEVDKRIKQTPLFSNGKVFGYVTAGCVGMDTDKASLAKDTMMLGRYAEAVVANVGSVLFELLNPGSQIDIRTHGGPDGKPTPTTPPPDLEGIVKDMIDGAKDDILSGIRSLAAAGTAKPEASVAAAGEKHAGIVQKYLDQFGSIVMTFDSSGQMKGRVERSSALYEGAFIVNEGFPGYPNSLKQGEGSTQFALRQTYWHLNAIADLMIDELREKEKLPYEILECARAGLQGRVLDAIREKWMT